MTIIAKPAFYQFIREQATIGINLFLEGNVMRGNGLQTRWYMEAERIVAL
jgi:hypothetical protein